MKKSVVFAAAMGAILLSATAAGAFTFENKDSEGDTANALAPGVQPYGDPADRLEPKKNFDDTTSTYKQGGMTLKFGREPTFNEKYDPSYLYDPLRR
jgi:hypothetical protein